MDYESIVQSMKRQMNSVGVDENSILELIAKKNLKSVLEDVTEGTYTLNRRVTSDQLVSEVVSTIHQSKEVYRQSVVAAINQLTSNLSMCTEIDSLFGMENNDSGDTVELKISKDGSHLLKCPISECSSTTFKLRRHLRDVHPSITGEAHEFAVDISKKIERNKAMSHDRLSGNVIDTKCKVKREEPTSLKLVARKGNYKKCMICNNLYLNLPDHVNKFHKISRTDASYDRFVRDPPTIPRCYTKFFDGRVVELEGKELQEAKMEFGDEVEEKGTDLEIRKGLREDIEKVREDLKTAKGNDRENKLAELEEFYEKYKNCRYPDPRTYSDKVKIWKEGYLDSLKKQNCKEPARVQRMAMDVFLDYEKMSGIPLTFDEISKPITVKNILLHFRDCKDKSNLSKITYVGRFSAFLEYLLVSIDSPEANKNANHQEMAARQFTYQQIQSEIRKELGILNKLKGKDIIAKKEKAKNKIVTDDEIEELMQRTRSFLSDISEQMKSDLHLHYNGKEITKIRDALIAVATVRLGRRSLEMTRMTLDEVKGATMSIIDGIKYFTINVCEQKNTYTGEAAPVVYQEQEYYVLLGFITHLRGKLTSDENCKVVFPANCKSNSRVDQSLGLSAAYKILQKFQTLSGKPISSRTIRGSIVSNSREKNFSEEHLNHLAKSMNHSRSTADSYYDYSSINNSIYHILSKTNSDCTASTSGLTISTPTKATSQTFDPDISIISGPSSSTESLSKNLQETSKRKTSVYEDPNGTSDLEETLIELRSKKVKFSSVDESLLKEEIKIIIRKMDEAGTKHSLITKNGGISVVPVNKELPIRLRSAPTKLLRGIIKEFLLTE